MGLRFTMPVSQWVNSLGSPLAGGKLYFYASGTSTPLTTYSDSALTVPNLNPVEADSTGTWDDIYLQAADYTVDLKTSTGAQVPGFPVGPVSGATSSADLSYLRVGTGTVTRTIKSKLSDVLSAKDYGATGDGSTDDYAALAAAFTDAVATSQRVVYVPTGTYMLSQTLNISNVSLIGEGAIATTFKPKATFSGSSVLLVDDTTGGGGGVDSIYENFRIYGNRSALSSTVHGLKLYGNALYNSFSKIRIQETKGVGILTEGKAGPIRPTLNTFTNVHVSSGDSDGLQMLAGRHMTFIDCAFEILTGKGINIQGTTEACSKISFLRPYIEAVSGDGIYFGAIDQSEVITPLVNGYGVTASACYGFRNAGSAASRNKLVGGDFVKNASPHANSKHIFYDGGDRLILENVNVASTDLTVSGSRSLTISNLQVTSASSSLMPFTNGRATIGLGLTRYLAPFTGAQSATRTDVDFQVPGYMTLSQFRADVTALPGGTETYGLLLLLNGGATSVALSLTNANGGRDVDITNEVCCVPGDTISLRVITSGAAVTIPLDGLHFSAGVRMR